MTQKTRAGFVTIALPVDLIDKIDVFIKNSIKHDSLYQKRPDVVKVALARFFKDNNNGGGF